MNEVLVLGAGLVGICSAIELQSQGHHVVLVDRTEPGLETSFGNAGVIQGEAVEPYQCPRDLTSLSRILFGRTNDVSWKISGVLSALPALLRYYRHSEPSRHALISHIYAQMIQNATADHEPLIEAAEAGHLISKRGLSCVFRDEQQLEHCVKDLKRLEQVYGVKYSVLDGAQCLRDEPAIKRDVAGAIHWLDSWSCSDPGLLARLYAKQFVALGGQIEYGDADQLRQSNAAWQLRSDSGSLIEAQHVVIALGPWAPKLLKKFGYRIPMVLKRGYHDHYVATESLKRPFVDMDYGVVAASVSQGLRVTSGAALVKHNDPPDYGQLNRGAAALTELLDLGTRADGPVWYGTRPCMPDMLPLVGVAPRHPSLWFNFGHGHQGFTLAPTTAKLLGQAMSGEVTPIGRALGAVNRVA